MKEKRDVLFLCQYFYPEYISSATLPYDTAKALVKAGYTVSALCGYPSEYHKDGKVPKKEVHAEIKIKRLRYLQLKRSNFIGRLINYFSFTFAVSLRFFSLKNYKSIIVYSNPPVLPLIAAWASKLFRVKMIFVCYDIYPEMAQITNSISKNGFISKMMQFINKRIYKNVNKVVALSTEMKEYLVKHREYIEKNQVYVISNWYKNKPIQDISKSYLNNKFTDLKPNDNMIISYFGNMGICQDLDTILHSIRILKNDNRIKFIFAGHGNKIDQLRKSIKEEHLDNAVVYDFLHGQDFQDALNISDVFLVSLAEGLTGLAVPSKTYSYMMAGKPVIAIMGVDADISKDLVNNNAGFAIDVGEVEKLVNSIIELRNDKKLREKMGSSIREVFEKKYTTEKATLKYVELIKETLEEK
jgi:glycosyltransferase involved in cell wall biosynthesis